ncbi:hypothetical protein GGX14DRAFT_695050, partial [Mycena pura]
MSPCPPEEPIMRVAACGTVMIYHPMLPNRPPFLRFSAFACKPSGGALGGVPLGFVLDICYVVAGNREGELHLKTQTQERVAGKESDLDGLVTPGKYVFVVVQDEGRFDYEYDLCPCFAAWTPPVIIPERWRGGNTTYKAQLVTGTTEVSYQVKFEDKACIVTGAVSGRQSSHVIPKSEVDWVDSHFDILQMYGGEAPDRELNSALNEVSLRADLSGQGLEQALFFFVPYAKSIITLFVEEKAPDLASQYHWRQAHFPTRIRRGYLFARFAWNAFKLWGSDLEKAMQSIEDVKSRRGLKRKHFDTEGGPKKGEKDDGGSGSGGDGRPGGSGSGGGNRGDGGRGSGGGSRGGGGPGSSGRGGRMRGIGKEEKVQGADDTEAAGGLNTDDEALLALYELVDAAVSKRACLTVDDVQAGRYAGFSKIKRLALQYRRAHPQISAVGGPCMESDDDASEGEM